MARMVNWDVKTKEGKRDFKCINVMKEKGRIYDKINLMYKSQQSKQKEKKMSDEKHIELLFPRDDKKATIRIKTTNYLVSTHFSLNDAEQFIDEYIKEKDYKKALAIILSDKIKAEDYEEIPTEEDIINTEEESFREYVLAVVSDSEHLQEIFDEIDEELPIRQRFAIAYKAYMDGCAKILAESMKPLIQTVQNIKKSINYGWITQMQETINRFSTPWLETMQSMMRTAQIVENAMQPFRQMAKTIAESIGNLNHLAISEEEIRRLEESYQKWGEIGWPVLPEAPFNFFNHFPEDAKEANNLAMQYCDKDAMHHLFEDLHNQKIKKDDLDSAIFCYEHKQFKACALLLFGLLDARMIRFQPRNSNRQVGERATKKLRIKMNEKMEEEQYLMTSLYQINLLSCLDTYFENGHNFVKEPETINRNFVDHGMNIRKVRKRDCIQLFIALRNFDEFLEFIS